MYLLYDIYIYIYISFIFVWYLFIHSNCVDSIYTYLGGLAIWYLKRWGDLGSILSHVIAVYSKLFPIKDPVFQFLIKHLHICNKFFYRMSNQEIYSIMLYQILQNKLCKLSPILLMLSCLFGHSKKSLILGGICKVVNSI